jgi:Maf1 regulator
MKYLEDEKLLKLTSELTDVVLGRSRSIHGRIEAYTMKRAGTDKKYAHALGERYVADMESVESQLAEYKSFMQRHTRFEQQSITAANVRGGRKRSMSTGSQLESVKPSKIQRPRANSYDGSMNSSPGRVQKSSLGDFGEIGTRRLMTDLILTLNSSFPDYDFGSIKPSDFEKIGVSTAIKRVNERLAEVAVSKPSILPDMWSAMDDAVHLSECEVYSYAPKTRDQDDEPLSFLTQTLIDPQDQLSSDDTSVSNGTSATVLWTFNYFFVNKSRKRIVFFTCVECMRNEGSNENDDEVSFVQYHGNEASDVDFDLDPSAGVAGGIPIDVPISII